MNVDIIPPNLPPEPVPVKPTNPALRALGWFTGWKLPSRNWMIFYMVTSTGLALALYDTSERRKIAADFKARASPLADVPMQPSELPRRIQLYIAPSQFARYNFKEYVKPVFDAAALDYELIQPDDLLKVQEHVKNYIWAGKAEHRGYKTPSNVPYNPYIPPPRPAYDPTEGLVAVGRGAWRELMKGVNEACLTLGENEEKAIEAQEQLRKMNEQRMSRRPFSSIIQSTTNRNSRTWYDWVAGKKPEDPVAPAAIAAPIQQDLMQDAAVTTSTETESTTTAPPPQPEAPLPPVLSIDNMPTAFALPPVGYISGQNLTGWTNFPLRIYHWFTSRNTARRVGEEALKIAFGAKRPLYSSDLAVGMKDIGEEGEEGDGIQLDTAILEKLSIYTETTA
ncbi:hypothetical protein SmJEL517_g05587 [Synchytrium microbalum]|uniref:Mitochondrial import inner membrane translocase subunit TIM54 n=1 Tax=Synchytrium microbalum TaxID=1806994 RepID=A0A507BYS6_9FUNG|nr:uncharacterized protein SmJEL517_g05587 [Synchytrium microbalum]TPX30964.1 hypothetical protein SmJEL517_g05587 [Synchytrium microbalum]